MAGKGKGSRAHSIEPSVSRTLGSQDTSDVVQRPGQRAFGGRNTHQKSPGRFANPFLTSMLEGEDCRIQKFECNGVAKFDASDLLEVEDEPIYSVLGRFAGRFPGLKAVDELVLNWNTKWNIKCKPESLYNGHVRFWFVKEADRDAILAGGPYALYGKRLFLRLPPSSPGFEEYKHLPVWVRLPGLPKVCWHENALGIIASCFGEPLYRDKMTKEMRRMGYARILVDIDCSVDQPEYIPVQFPDGSSFDQPISFEALPFFCTGCGSNRHVTEDCRLIPAEKSPETRAICPAQMQCSTENDGIPAPIVDPCPAVAPLIPHVVTNVDAAGNEDASCYRAENSGECAGSSQAGLGVEAASPVGAPSFERPQELAFGVRFGTVPSSENRQEYAFGVPDTNGTPGTIINVTKRKKKKKKDTDLESTRMDF